MCGDGNDAQVHGSVIGREIKITGTADFHYDEALSRVLELTTTLKQVSWRRVAVPTD